MKIDILTIFPDICRGPLGESIIGRAQESGAVEIVVHDLRDWTEDRHRRVDDEPYGGGPGMVMKPEPFFAAVEELRTEKTKVVLMTPQGQRFDQSKARGMSREGHLILLCGHYEGVDHRVVEALVDIELSIGDYVLTNGAIAATVMVDAIVRLIPGVLGDDQSVVDESFSDGRLIEGPHYTRPSDFKGMVVPEVLLSGHHAKIVEWRQKKAEERTKKNRPDLLK